MLTLASDKLTEVVGKYDLDKQDLTDLMVFALGLDDPPPKSMTPKKVLQMYSQWWGGKLPSYWEDVAKEDLAALTKAALQEASKPPKTAGGLLFGAAIVAAATRAQSDREAQIKDRNARARAKDTNWNPPNGSPNLTIYSHRTEKFETFQTTDTANYVHHQKNIQYDNYVWAMEKVGETPVTRKEFGASVKHWLKSRGIIRAIHNMDLQKVLQEAHSQGLSKQETADLRRDTLRSMAHLGPHEQAKKSPQSKAKADPKETATTYKSYVDRKKSEGEPTKMTREQWEARFKKSAARVASLWLRNNCL